MKFKEADFTGIRHGVEKLWANQNSFLTSKFVSRFSKAVENSQSSKLKQNANFEE
jgi:hypothetical protein